MHQDWYEFIKNNSSNINPFCKEDILCSLAHYGLVKASGKDAKKLLQGQLTCDIDQIGNMQSTLGAQCNSKGRVISLFYLFAFKDSYYLCMPRSLLTLTLAALKKYALFYQVELSDASETLGIIGYASKAIFPETSNIIQIPIYQGKGTSYKRYVAIGEFATLKTFWNELSKSLFIADSQAWHHLNILQGIPTLYVETSEKFLPQEINLDQLKAISLEKGCYTGQEIIARMHYRSKQKNRMVQATLMSHIAPKVGSDILSLENPHPFGMIVDWVSEEKNHYRVLIVVNELDLKNNHLYLENKDHFFIIPEPFLYQLEPADDYK